MAYEQREGQGSMFRNEKQNDRQPDFKGTILINGKTYEIAAWEKTSQRGLKYLSLQASEPRERSRFTQPTQDSVNTGFPSISDADFPAAPDSEDLPF